MAHAHGPKAPNRRGSPEAVEKRRVARLFNEVVGGGGASRATDGRTEKRRQRLLRELEAGLARGKRPLKPIDVLLRVNELLDLGETVARLKKVVKARPVELDADATLVEVVARLHEAYGFRVEAYRFVGIGEDVLAAAGVGAAPPRKRRAVSAGPRQVERAPARRPRAR